MNPEHEFDSPGSGGRVWVWLGIPLLLFAVGLMFCLGSFGRYHGDEKFYTNASLRMIETGDYWTPYFADGRVRLLKPVLNYWALAGSFKVFGINLFSSRLPALIWGVMIVCFTAYLAWLVFGSRLAAVLSGLIIVSTVDLMMLSCRATPDALVAFWVLFSLCGFARVIFREDGSFVGPLMGWAGVGLAVQTKGLLGIFPLVVCGVFILVGRGGRCKRDLVRMLDWRAVAIGVVLALFWYVVMLKIHGAGSLRAFVDDQVTAKVQPSPVVVLSKFVRYALTWAQQFAVWIVVCAAAMIALKLRPGDSAGTGRPRGVKAFWRDNREKCIFVGLLLPLLVITFSFGSMRSARYVALGYPGMAVLMGGFLATVLDTGLLQKGIRWAVRTVCGLLVVLGIALVVAGLRIDGLLVGGGAAVLIGAGLGLWCSWRREAAAPLTAIATLIVLGFVVFEVFVRPVTRPSPVPALARALAAEKVVSTWKVEEVMVSQLIMASGGRVDFELLPVAPEGETGTSVLLTVPDGVEEATAAGYRPVSTVLAEPPEELRKLLVKVNQRERSRPSWRDMTYWVGKRD